MRDMRVCACVLVRARHAKTQVRAFRVQRMHVYAAAIPPCFGRTRPSTYRARGRSRVQVAWGPYTCRCSELIGRRIDCHDASKGRDPAARSRLAWQSTRRLRCAAPRAPAVPMAPEPATPKNRTAWSGHLRCIIARDVGGSPQSSHARDAAECTQWVLSSIPELERIKRCPIGMGVRLCMYVSA